MKLNSKKCKGTGRAAGFGCGDMSSNRKYGLSLTGCKCYQNWLFSTDAGKEVLSKTTLQASKKVTKEKKKEKTTAIREMQYSNKSIAKLIQEARIPFQKLIRMRDHGKPCVCCGGHLGYNLGDRDAGHFLKAELYTGLIFHPDNVHGQRKYCNDHLGGNEAEYSVNLPSRIGMDRFRYLIENKARLRMYRWGREQLYEMKTHYLSELRKVEKGIKTIDQVDFNIGIIHE